MNDLPHHLELWFDGLCEPNPGGPATFAWILKDEKRQVLAEDSGEVKAAPGGKLTNNYAEYVGLGRALKAIADADWKEGRLVVRGDSELIVKQMSGVWTCKSDNLSPLFGRCTQLLATLSCDATFHWVSRDDNLHCDMLTRKVYRELTGNEPPNRERRGR